MPIDLIVIIDLLVSLNSSWPMISRGSSLFGKVPFLACALGEPLSFERFGDDPLDGRAWLMEGSAKLADHDAGHEDLMNSALFSRGHVQRIGWSGVAAKQSVDRQSVTYSRHPR